MHKRGILITVIALLVIIVGVWIYFGSFYVKMPQKSEGSEAFHVEFDEIGEPDLKAGTEAYSELVSCVELRKKTVTFADANEASYWMDYFRTNNPLAVLVDSYTLKDNKVKLKFAYQSVKHKKMIEATRRYLTEYLLSDGQMDSSEYGKGVALYHKIATGLKQTDEKSDSIYETLRKKKGDADSIARITAFLYNQAGFPTYAIMNEEKTEAGVQSEIDGEWFYHFPGKESLQDKGVGIHYFGCNDKFNEYVFGEETVFQPVNAKQKIALCNDTRFSPIHWIAYYEQLDGDVIRAHYQDWSVATVEISSLKKILEKDRGFLKTVTEDGYRYYVFEPEEYFPKKKGEKYPLVIVLHGSGGAAGSLFRFGPMMTTEGFQEEIGGAYVAIMWSKLEYYREPKRYNELVADIIHDHPNIDPDNVFIYGFSNGAVFTSEMLVENPELYRGTIASGTFYNWSDEDIQKIKGKALWLIGGAKDEHVVCYAENLAYERLSAAGIDISYYEFPTKGHTPVAILEKVDSLGGSATDWMKDRMKKKNAIQKLFEKK